MYWALFYGNQPYTFIYIYIYISLEGMGGGDGEINLTPLDFFGLEFLFLNRLPKALAQLFFVPN